MSLLDNEKTALAKKVGSTASIITSAVVRFYLASPNPKANKKDPASVLKNFPDLSDSQWKYTNVMGGLVLVVDRTLDTFLFRVYDLEAPHELRFEYELYEDIEYKALDVQFHAFEMDDCVGGFSFSSKDEAPKFLAKVNALKPTSKNNAVDALKGGKKKPAAAASSTSGGGGGGLFGKKSKPKAVPEMQISAVVNVTHTQHIGMGADGTFDLNNISPEWKALFRQAGIKKKDLANPETARAIADTIMRTQPPEKQAEIKSQMKQQQQQQQNNTPAEVTPKASAVVVDPLKIDLEQAKQVYTAQQLKEIADYQAAMKKYEEELAAYEAEQTALANWERDNKKIIEERAAKAKLEEAERVRREKLQKEREEKERQEKELANFQAEQHRLEEKLKEQERIMQEKNAEQDRKLKEAGAKGVAPAPPPRKIQAPTPVVVEEEEVVAKPAPPPMPVRRKASIVQVLVQAVKGPTPEELAEQEREKKLYEEKLRLRELELQRQEEEMMEREAALRKKRAEERERALLEEENNWKAERERIRREMEASIRAEEEEIRKRAEQDRIRMQQEAEAEQARLHAELAAAKNAAEKTRIEEQAKQAALEAERARVEKEAKEIRDAQEREAARLAAEQAQREQEETLLQLQVMQMKTAEAKRLMEEEERRQEELRKKALEKKAPPLPARLPERPPLPPPPVSAPRPPPPPPTSLVGALMKPSAAPAAGGLSGALAGLGGVQLKKAENIVDKSGPNVTGKMGRDAQKAGFLGALEKGVKLNKVEKNPIGGGGGAELPKLNQGGGGGGGDMQATIMSSLVAVMNSRRGALQGDDSDDEDDWSD